MWWVLHDGISKHKLIVNIYLTGLFKIYVPCAKLITAHTIFIYETLNFRIIFILDSPVGIRMPAVEKQQK